MPLNYPESGANWAVEYSVSGIPWLTSSILGTSETRRISFYGVTKELIVKNVSGSNLQVGFSQNGVQGSNNIALASGESVSMAVRCREVFLFGTAVSFCVFASITGIQAGNVPFLTGSNPDGTKLDGVG